MKSKTEIQYKLKTICEPDFYIDNATNIPEQYKNYWAGYRDALYAVYEYTGVKSNYRLPWE